MAPTSPTIPDRKYFRTPATAPGPSGQRMLTHFGAIRSNPVNYLMRVWGEYGDVVQFPIPSPPSYLVNEPDAVRRVLVGNARNYGKATIQYRSLSLVTGHGLLTADTEQWRVQRPLVQPAFHRDTLTHVAQATVPIATRLAQRWAALAPGSVVDVDEAMMAAALEVVGQALFGTDLSADASRLTAATLDALDVVIARSRPSVPIPSWVPTPENRKLRRALSELDTAVAGLLAGRDSAGAVGQQGADMVGMLLAARDGTGRTLTPTEVRDQLVTFIVAGHETVASALTWGWALLARNPQVQDRLAEEAWAVLGDLDPSYADYQRLPYARAVLDEALRLYPPAWLLTRNALGPDELGGFAIPAGALVILSPWLLHRHPDRWDDPERFDPQRHLDGRADRTGFIPFGAGPRQCVGKDFAYVEGVLMLAILSRALRFWPPRGHEAIPDFDPLVTVRPAHGLPLMVAPRPRGAAVAGTAGTGPELGA